jgi:predicted anti-sigma-YlaC factor YlaD
MSPIRSAMLIATVLFCAGGCSVRQLAIKELGDALAAGGSAWASDNDPELIGDALPFSLKLIESLLAESPRHRGLLLAATSGFTQYSYGWIHQQAEQIEDEDLEAANAMRQRARNLYLRARDYGLRGLSVQQDGFAQALRTEPKGAVQRLERDDVPLMYWTAAAWGLAISQSKDQPELVADLPIVEALVDRALQLDETFEGGAIHAFLISYEPNRPGASGDPYQRARRHFDRAVEISGGNSASPFVAFAEQISVATQNRAEFESLLNRAQAVDVDARPEWRLANIIAQRRARWLLGRVDDLFLSENPDSNGETNEP